MEWKQMVEKIAIKFNEDNLTLGDLEDFEDIVGVGLFDALKPTVDKDDDGKPVRDEKGRPVSSVKLTAKALKALVYVVLRAERPGFSLDDARNIKVTALEIESDVEEEAPEGNDGAALEAAPETVPAETV